MTKRLSAATEIQILMDKEQEGSRDHEILETTLGYIEAGATIPHDLIMQTQRIMNKGVQQNRYGQ